MVSHASVAVVLALVGSAAVRADEHRLLVDPATGAVEGEMVVDATSLESGNARRDKQMHRKVLASAEYPRIVFRPRAFTGVFDLQPVDDGVHIAASFQVPYVAWGLPNPSRVVLRVAKEVEVEIEGTVTLAGAAVVITAD